LSEELGELLEHPEAMNTTTQPETANVTVQKVRGLGDQQPSLALAGKVQRLGSDPVGSKRIRSAEHLYAGGDVVRAASKEAEVCWKRAHRNSFVLKRPVVAFLPPLLAAFGLVHTLFC
jgi:hypothetical protein